jgi:hypothetical protein
LSREVRLGCCGNYQRAKRIESYLFNRPSTIEGYGQTALGFL